MISTGVMRNIALVGISKNSGKTTLLNGILAAHPEQRWAVLSTGIDGETEDRVFKTPKPRVRLHPGCIFCCDSAWLDTHKSAVTVLYSKEYAGRALYLARAETALETQITGPSSVRQQREIMLLMHRYGADKVLVDGSLDRKSIALEKSIDMLILAIGASFGTTEQIILELQRLLILREIPLAELSRYETKRLESSENILFRLNGRWWDSRMQSLIRKEKEVLKLLERNPQALYIPTSLTDAVYERLSGAFAAKDVRLVIRHPECLKLSLPILNQLVRDNRLSCLIPFKIKAFALNSTAVGKEPVAAEQFRQEIRGAFPQETFYDVMELQ